MLVGKELGPYLIDKELGSGAMGTVFRGTHKSSGDRVAIKLMSIALGTNEAAVNRFTREVSILKQLDHVNIVKYKGSGRYHKAPFYVMEYIEGESLDHVLGRRKRLTWEEVVEIGMHLCAALQHAHDKGIIHRDLKPSNLMILKDGTVKLTDFGIAKDTDVTALTAANSTVGTAAYMSPEQCRGNRDINHKSDLYSMGVMFYELLTGRKPFTGETAMEIFLQHANKTDYRRPQEFAMEIPIWLDTLVMQLMEKEPARRPLSANAVADALRLIKEKVEAQRSAGVEAVTKRRVDRTGADKGIDKEDTEIARTLLGKKKKKAPAFYTRGWFTILALAVVASLFLTCVYFVFLRTPSAESLYREAETLMKSSSSEDHKSAREGPIAMFLKHYKTHEKCAQVQKWADDFDFETLDRQMHNRLSKDFKIAGEEEKRFREAIQRENRGELKDAAKLWEELARHKGNADADLHAWGLLGERYGQTLKDVDELHQQLRAGKFKAHDKSPEATAHAAAAAELLFEKAKSAGEPAKAEADAKLKQAREKWSSLRDDTKNRSEHRRWHLLAAKRLHELPK